MNLLKGMLVESGPGMADEGGSGIGIGIGGGGVGVAGAGAGGRGPLCVAFPGASVPLPPEVADAVRGAGPDVVLGVRPEALHLSPDGVIAATVLLVELLGAETHVICHSENDERIIVRQSAGAPKPALGEAVRIAVDPDPDAYHLFDAVTGERLGEAKA